MTEIVLMVFFLINGQPTSVEGFMPHPQPNMLVCQERAEQAQAYFDSLEGQLPEAIVGCYRKMEGSPT